MRIQTDTNLLFDDEHPECFYIISSAEGQLFAFVQCLDVGGNKKPRPKRYWGAWDWDAPEQSIKHILKNGGKWPQLSSNA
ncbi:hypothetical protein L3V77_15730 [Vibrio sp. DW001]|uniref:hypothetical protein n=1 Tax=Vibrio sp. DW001 TaxID=2912315 RepID=UPI0023B06894|nr:hypothetical protein [Vibrio sp. DW001]WED26427.1 hypothetical protein L3V77_15730 [Vibrio sp. DW001]